MPRVLSESDVADFRERLCDVAEKLFAEKGPDAVTMRQLASELGVSPMTPYRYFADKEFDGLYLSPDAQPTNPKPEPATLIA